MTIKCLCPNCYHPAQVTGTRREGWLACVKCGHVFRVCESAEKASKSSLPANSPHLGLRTNG